MSRITHDICNALGSRTTRRTCFNPMVYLCRHPIAVRAFFRHSLVLTYALPCEVLTPLIPPGLALDAYRGFGFVAIAMVQTEGLRPTFCPEQLGRNFFLSGYRIFARYRTHDGRTLRGLRILRSDTDRRSMAFFGNQLTHYNYQKAEVALRETSEELEIKIKTSGAEADLHVVARIGDAPCADLPAGSPFQSLREARLFAGPLPFTFDYEKETNSIVRIEGVRQNWKPVPVKVNVLKNTFFNAPAFRDTRPILANAFHVANIHYSWKRGVLEQLAL